MLRQNKTKNFSKRVGLDIGSHSIKAVEVVERGAEIVVRSAGAVALPIIEHNRDSIDNDSIVQALKTLWAKAKFKSNQVVLALSPESVYTKWLHLEAPDREALDATARAAAARGAPFPPEDAVTDYRVLSSRGTFSKNVHFVMLIAASASAIDALLDIVDAAGLDPLAVDIGAAAALRCFDAHKRASGLLWSGQPVAHCVIGARTTTISVMRNGELEFARTVPVGGNDFTDCIANYCGITWPEAEKIKTMPSSRLVEGGNLITSHDNQELRIPCEAVLGRLTREIQRSLRFFSSQFAEGSYLGMIGATTLSGGTSLMKGLDTCLEEQGVDIAGVINPFAGLSVDAEAGVQRIGETAAQYSIAMGLALGDYWSSEMGPAAETELAA
jgi:type IV pilus assembly protein PilM